MKKRQLFLSSLVLVLLLVACAPQAAPAPQKPAPAAVPAAPAAAPVVPAASVKPAWQQEWDKTLAAARQEGKVVVVTAGGGDIRRVIVEGLKNTYGLDAEVVVGTSSELVAKAIAEAKAGLHLTDVHLGGASTVLKSAKPAGILRPIDQAMILPDVTDPELIKKTWYQGKLPYVEKDRNILIIALQPGPAITINTNLVKPDEMKSWRDLLNPKWSGKLAYNDPTISGYGQMCAQAMVNIMGESYVKELANAKPLIIRDRRQLVEWLAFGKIAIAVAAQTAVIVEFVSAGAPIKVVLPQEGTWLGPGDGAISWIKDSPHPNASKVFINWLASKEGQDLFAPAAGFHSTREDVSTAHLLPGLARTPGAKYFDSYTEEAYDKRPVTDKIAKDLFGPLLK